MSRLYEALRKSEMENQQKGVATAAISRPAEPFTSVASGLLELEAAQIVRPQVSPDSHLVAMTESQSLAAEKFRVLVTRLNNLRSERELKSLQVTSGVADEGKTIIAANLAVTFAKHSKSRVLLVEGDLHKPGLQSLLQLDHLKGIREWWPNTNVSLSNYLY